MRTTVNDKDVNDNIEEEYGQGDYNKDNDVNDDNDNDTGTSMKVTVIAPDNTTKPIKMRIRQNQNMSSVVKARSGVNVSNKIAKQNWRNKAYCRVYKGRYAKR